VGATLISCCPQLSWQGAVAADFTQAKKVFVPPSRIPRRFDSEAQEDGYTNSTNSSYSSGYNQSFGMPGSEVSVPPSKNKPSKYGLIPPPPPLTPSLLPASLMHSQVPPPPPLTPSMTPMSGLAAAAQKGQWSTTVQRSLKRAANSPKVASFLDQAQGKAQELIKEGKVAQAQELLQNYVKNLPRDKSLQTELANVTVQHAKQLMANQDFQSAAKNLRSALTLQPGSTSAQNMLDQIFQKQGMSASNAGDRLKEAATLAGGGKNSEAEFEYKAALKLNPSADGHVGLGDLELKAGNKEKASQEYQKALEVEPHSATALRQMGLLRLGQNDLPGANSNLSRALVVNPKDQVASSHLIDLWQKQVAHNTGEVNGHLGLARAYQLSGDLQSAQTEYRKVVQIEPNNPNLPLARQSFKLALARQEAGKAMDSAHTLASAGALQEAYQRTTEAVALSPGDTSIRMFQGQLAEKMGLGNEAHAIYMNVLHDDPKNMAAAQRLTALSSPAGAQAFGQAGGQAYGQAAGQSAGQVGQSAAGLASLLPGLTPPVAPSFNRPPGSIFATPEAPPAASLPGIPKPPQAAQPATTGQVGAMSSFLTSMRTFHYQQKAAIEKAEEESKKNIDASIGAPAKPSPMSGALASPDSINSLTADVSVPNDAPMLNAAGNNLADVQKLLKSIGAGSKPTLGAAAGTASTAPSAAPSSAAATGSLSTAKNAEFAALAKKYGLPYSGSSAATTAASAPAASTASSAANDAISQRLGNLEAQNRQLQSQLAAAQQRLNSMQQPGAGTGMPEAPSIAPSMPSNMMLPGNPNLGIPASTLPSFPQGYGAGAASSTPSSAALLALAGAPSAASALSGLSPQTQGEVQAMLRDRIATQPTNGNVRFELEGVKPSAMDIKLNVVLHNDQGVPLYIPPTVKAIIRMNGQPQRTVKLTFPTNAVAANGEVHGSIKVPGHNLSPAADVFIPNLLPATVADRDVHLTVPISYLR